MKNQTRFLLGVFVSRLGDSFSFLAFTILLLDQGLSNFNFSLFLISRYLPSVIIGLGGRHYIEHLPKKKSLIIAYFASAVLTATSCFTLRSPHVLLFFSLCLGISYAFYVPLQKALIADIFPRQKIKWGNTATQMADVIAKTIGFMLAGIVIHGSGAKVAILIDALSFIGISALFSTLSIANERSIKSDRAQLKSQPIPSLVKSVSVIFAIAWIGTGTLFALEASYARVYLRADETIIGWIFACATFGAIGTPFIVARLKDLAGITALTVSVLAEMLCVGDYAYCVNLPTAVCFIVGHGFFLTIRHIIIGAWIHTQVPSSLHSSSFAYQQGLANLAMLTGMGLSGPLSSVIDVRTVITASAGLSITIVLIYGGKIFCSLVGVRKSKVTKPIQNNSNLKFPSCISRAALSRRFISSSNESDEFRLASWEKANAFRKKRTNNNETSNILLARSYRLPQNWHSFFFRNRR